MSKHFLDTSALINYADLIYPEEEDGNRQFETFAVSSITLAELNKIALTSKDGYRKVRQATKVLIAQNCEVIPFNDDGVEWNTVGDIITKYHPIRSIPDYKIMATALIFALNSNEDVIFSTSDMLQWKAMDFFASRIDKEVIANLYMPSPPEDDYSGGFYVDHMCDEVDISLDYEYVEGQYIYKRNEEGRIVEVLVFRKGSIEKVNFIDKKTSAFGAVKPMGGDFYQRALMDSFEHNRVTMVKGPAGTGKTFLSLGYGMYLLESGKIDRIVVFCNTVATANSAKMGYYPGTKDEKLIDSQIGNLLSSKLGGRMELERLINMEQIVLLPMSDIRGYDTSGTPSLVYISEAQNMDISLMKLALQRIGEDSYCIIDGDCKAQVDLASFAGNNNGMRRASKVFRGTDIYGEVTLKNIYRSRIAKIAENM